MELPHNPYDPTLFNSLESVVTASVGLSLSAAVIVAAYMQDAQSIPVKTREYAPSDSAQTYHRVEKIYDNTPVYDITKQLYNRIDQ